MKKEETAKILDRVLEFSKNKGLFDCGIIVVGLSGGPDSVALLHILKGLSDRGDIICGIRAFHCNHHLRPDVCDKEADMVRDLCQKLGIELKVLDFDCKGFAEQNRISEETAGRVLRYEAFEQYALALENSYGKEVRIAIAHHRDDIAETMMMNLFRGAGLEGLVNPKPQAGRIIRPLLCVNKKELVDYLECLGADYAVDQTNLTTEGTRNTWRNDLLPKIGGYYKEDPSVPLTRTYKLLSDDLDLIDQLVKDAYSLNRRELAGHPVLSVSGVKELHPAVRSRVIRRLWLETFGNLTDFEETHLSGAATLLERDCEGELTLDMSFARKAYRHGDIFAFTAGDKTADLAGKIAEDMGFIVSQDPVNIGIDLRDITKNGEICTKIPNSAINLKARIIENKGDLEYNNFLWFCPFDVLQDGRITLSNRNGIRSDLRMRKAGANGSKDLNRLMTDLKIPESSRGQILFIEDQGNVLWLPGFGHAAGFTNAVSRERYIASCNGEGSVPDTMIMFSIERQ